MKNIPIEKYLRRIGFTPAIIHSDCALIYNSPFRREITPSFFVDKVNNTWYDCQINIGGDLISFVTLYYQLDNIRDAGFRIERDISSYPTKVDTPPQLYPWDYRIEILKYRNELDYDMRNYLRKRHITDPMIQNLCSAVYCRVLGKDYKAIGFRDNDGGFGVRNLIFHGHSQPDAMTLIREEESPSHVCCLFNDFMDYLSFLSIRDTGNNFIPEHSDCLLFGSPYVTDKTTSALENYEFVFCCFSNDIIGQKMADELSLSFYATSRKFINLSSGYGGYRTLNEYLCRTQGKNQNEEMSWMRKMKMR